MSRWSKGVHPHEGALGRHGWSAGESEERRHAALERSVRADGYARTIERLDFVANVSGRENEELKRAATADRSWLESEDGYDDPRREGPGTHNVRRHEAERDGRTHPVREHRARNPRRR